MDSTFDERSIYSDKASIIQPVGVYWVSKGGFGIRGAEGRKFTV